MHTLRWKVHLALVSRNTRSWFRHFLLELLNLGEFVAMIVFDST